MKQKPHLIPLKRSKDAAGWEPLIKTKCDDWEAHIISFKGLSTKLKFWHRAASVLYNHSMWSSSNIAITIQESAGSQSQKKDENKREKRSRDTDTDVDGDRDGDGVHQPQPLLVRCSSSEDKVKNKKKKQQELIPMTATITKNISITKTITLTTPFKDLETDVCLYLCLFKGSDPDGHCYRWCKIDPTNQSPKSKSKSKWLRNNDLKRKR
ncbi:hypothetical protein LguiA_025559 [Lonicera macranthoides]